MLRLAMVVLWPSFLVAVLAEGLFFSVVSPDALGSLPPLAMYSIGFFGFWTFCSLASMLTCYLVTVPDQQPPF